MHSDGEARLGDLASMGATRLVCGMAVIGGGQAAVEAGSAGSEHLAALDGGSGGGARWSHCGSSGSGHGRESFFYLGRSHM